MPRERCVSHQVGSRHELSGTGCGCLVAAGACTAVVSLEPTIEPDSAVSVPTPVGDWIKLDEEGFVIERSRGTTSRR